MDEKIYYYLDQVDRLMKGEFVGPVTCEIDPSNKCPLRCGFCMFENYLEENRVNLDYTIYESLLCELKELGTKSITFTGGGEPLAHPKIGCMIEDAINMGFEIGLVTNAVLLDKIEDHLDKFMFIRVSLDAYTREMYKDVKGGDFFDKVISNIKMAVSKNKTVGISYVINEKNNYNLELAQELADELGVAYIQMKPAYINGGTFKDYKLPDGKVVIKTDRYMAEDHIPCSIASLVGVVSATGAVYFCCQFRGNDNFKLGDLHLDPFGKIWERRLEMKPDISKCPQCRYMNYAKAYKEILEKGTLFFKHRNFL
jgi:MoaA/NifB/PqqE/SkfB family radical SAM enzyme